MWWLLLRGTSSRCGYRRISEESRKLTQMELLCKGKDELLSTNVYIHVLSTLWPPPQAYTDTQNEHAHTTCSHHVRTIREDAHTWKCSHTVYSTHTYTPHTCSQDIPVTCIHAHHIPHTQALASPLIAGVDSGICRVGGELSPLCTTEYPGEVAFALEHEGQV